MSMLVPSPRVLIYDGHCRLCQSSVSWLKRRDTNLSLDFLEVQAPDLLDEFPQLSELDLLREITLIRQDGRILRGAEAMADALTVLPGWKWAGHLLGLPGMTWLSRFAYRGIAGTRYTLFGRACDSECAVSARTPVPPQGAQRIRKGFAISASLLILTAVLLPLKENWKARGTAIDSFPLSYFPMFSMKRPRVYRQTHVLGIRPDGVSFPIPYRLLGSGGLNQVRRQLRKLIEQDDRTALRSILASVAEQLQRSNKPSYQDCVALEVVVGYYDLDRYFSQSAKEPLRLEVLEHYAIDPNGHSIAGALVTHR